jgi:hypothetical protein
MPLTSLCSPGLARPPAPEGPALIDLVDLVEDLRDQLEQAQTAAKGERLQFELGSVELELTVAISTDKAAGAKVRIYVLEFGADAKHSEMVTQKVKLSLTARNRVDGDRGPARENESGAETVVYIAGKELTDER